MEFDVDVCRLSPKFFQDYPEEKYPEIMRKEGRPYNCILVDAAIAHPPPQAVPLPPAGG